MLKELGLQGITVIMIAHRLSTIEHANQIFVMEKGNIIEEGSHVELLFKKVNIIVFGRIKQFM